MSERLKNKHGKLEKKSKCDVAIISDNDCVK